MCVCSFIPASVEPRAHLAPMRAAASRCLSLIHERWTASAAIPLPLFYITYLSKKHCIPPSSHRSPMSPTPTDRLSRDAIFLCVGRILHLHLPLSICCTKSLLVLDLGVSLQKPSLSFPPPLPSLRDYRFYLKCHKPFAPHLVTL